MVANLKFNYVIIRLKALSVFFYQQDIPQYDSTSLESHIFLKNLKQFRKLHKYEIEYT